MAVSIEAFRMPRYGELPDVGLYLDQTIKYINRVLAPLGCMEITPSMVSNYVKKGYIPSPVHKQYDAPQLARLLFIAIAKNVLSMERIMQLFALKESQYSDEVAYNYFCSELENILRFIFGVTPTLEVIGSMQSEEKEILRSVIVAVANVIYINDRLQELSAAQPDA